MKGENNLLDKIVKIPLSYGAYKSKIISTKEIILDRSFRDICATNACGMYGKCWMCPPDVGNIDNLMSVINDFDYALVYQTISNIEDSFDFEGMMQAKRKNLLIALNVRNEFSNYNLSSVLNLGGGGCGICKVCARTIDEPCRHPNLALPSLETYGINVSLLSVSAGMKYTNGENTVTYFGAVLFSL